MVGYHSGVQGDVQGNQGVNGMFEWAVEPAFMVLAGDKLIFDGKAFQVLDATWRREELCAFMDFTLEYIETGEVWVVGLPAHTKMTVCHG